LQEKAHIAKLPGSRTCENGLSSASIHDIWRAFALAPYRFETFELSKDPLLIEKVREIVDFDARNSFTDFNGDGTPRAAAPFHQNEFGGVIGGPVRIPLFYDGGTRPSFSLAMRDGATASRRTVSTLCRPRRS
jgi:hypothetical protein